MNKPKLVVLSGAGISAESGISTFRDSNGLWEGHDVMDVASPEGWRRNKELVIDFYNQRRKNVVSSQPNQAHTLLAKLEDHYDVHIVTQNVDDLHERAGSTQVLHLHGEIRKSRSTRDERLIYPVEGWELNVGDTCELGSQLRPHIVWFGEMVPAMEQAMEIVMKADVFLVIGTSLVVYPAAGLMDYVAAEVPKYLIDPQLPQVRNIQNLMAIQEKGTVGMHKWISDYLNLPHLL